MIKVRESQIQKAIIDYLQYKNVLFTRHNPTRIVGKGHLVRIPDYEKGVADIICFHKGRYIELEIKSAKGKQSSFQKLREQRVKEAGGEYYLIHSIHELTRILY